MAGIYYDPDEWELVSTYKPCGCGGYPGGKHCTGNCNAAASCGKRRRAPEEVARIKAERLRKEEDEILARADRIRAARANREPPT